jgi:hypothetical protein
MSICLALANFSLAAFEYKNFHCLQYSPGIAYWGAMELLQLMQHFVAASPHDNYAMCESKININMTRVAMLHLTFQPTFLCMLLMGLYRRFDLTARIEADLVLRMSIFVGLWFAGCILDTMVYSNKKHPIGPPICPVPTTLQHQPDTWHGPCQCSRLLIFIQVRISTTGKIWPPHSLYCTL